MVALVNRHVRPLVFVLVLAQLLLSAPIVNAMAGAATHASPACASHVPGRGHLGSGHHDTCPCCPDGVMTDAGCLAACTAGAAPLQSVPSARVVEAVIAPNQRVVTLFVGFSEPPLKPPPIR